MAAAVAFIAGNSLAGAEPPPGSLAQVEMLQNTLATIAERVNPSVVAIRASRPALAEDHHGEPFPDDDTTAPHGTRPSRAEPIKYPAVGSGIVIAEDGVILTNEHVVLNAEPADITVTLSSGETYRVQEVMSDPRRDLAVLRIDARDLKPARLGDLASVRQGHFAIVMGNPFGSASDGNNGKPAMSFGIISALGRQITQQLDPLARKYYGNLIQTDAKVNPGNSGGPLLSIQGEVIGITTAISTRSGGSQGVGYAIPICVRTKEIIAQLVRGEEVDYGFLGVRSRSATEDECPRTGAGEVKGGAIIEEIETGSPADIARLQVGDLITAVGGRPITDSEELIQEIGSSGVGRPIDLTVWRAGNRLTLPVVPARREIPPPNSFSWRGMTLAHADWERCWTFKLPPDVKGLVVTDVKAGGPADRAGLKTGQVVIQIADVKLPFVRKLPQITGGLSGPVRVVLSGNPPKQLTIP
ncbi:MAG TPA: trypsin-like peptidase domain-containing protein [Phycisphaerae bacterium]|nr:trypsin-like peptidase domain-containing protein [Phycisphaerae bacterium]